MGFLSKLKEKLSFSKDTVKEEKDIIESPVEQEQNDEVIAISPVETENSVEEVEPDDLEDREEVKEEVIKEVIDDAKDDVKIETEIDEQVVDSTKELKEESIEIPIEEKPSIEEPVPEIKEEPQPETKEKVEDIIDDKPKKKGFFSKLTDSFKFEKTKTGLTKTRRNFLSSFASIFKVGQKITPETLDELEELLITSDIGVETTEYIIDELKARIKKEGFEDAEDCYRILKDILRDILIKSPSADNDKIFDVENNNKPYTILVVGVNGVGKTTTIGKMANNYRVAGKDVVIGAADTFRAAANDQLEIWAERAGVQIVQQGLGADPAAVAYDTLKSAIAKDKDVVIIDTAGRLHNKKNLMNELEKISRVLKKLKDSAPDEVYLVLDATTGQNAIIQAIEFSKVTPITGIVLTKLDGTAKGGVVIPIAHTLKVPVRYIGLGEGIDDLIPFDPAAFIEGMFSITDEDVSAIDD
ncbi:MAG: signal recognition particle-docking protein FtsY [Bacteroidetes bacterium 4572_77]|nr:MAG: signal recognition particle-docking protein FtsY [Bacteroidetes bacterium 4572_77]